MAKLITPGVSVGFLLNGKWLTAASDHAQYNRIEALVAEDAFKEAADLIDLKTTVSTMVSGSDIVLNGNELTYQGFPVRGTLGRRLIDMYRKGYNAKPLEAFLRNLMTNPSERAVNELYDFLESSKLPITDDGYFLAYKSVRDNFTDHHTGKMDNSVGAVVEMPRNQVDEDKDRTCSRGLHFAAHEYAKGFCGGRMVILKINPRDVVSIPSDYNNQKGRACKYEILEEVKRDDTKLVDAGVVGTHDTYVPQANNYDDDNLWWAGEFEGTASEFPVNKKARYTLGRNKDYDGEFFFDSYQEKHDNLVFKRVQGFGDDGKTPEFKYVTISDVKDWEITVTHETEE